MGWCWFFVLIVAVLVGCNIMIDGSKQAIAIDTYQKVEIAKAQRREELIFAEEQHAIAMTKSVAEVEKFFGSVGKAFGELSDALFRSDDRGKQVRTRW